MSELCLGPFARTRSAAKWVQLSALHSDEPDTPGLDFAPLTRATRRPRRENSGVRGHEPRQIKIYLERESVEVDPARR